MAHTRKVIHWDTLEEAQEYCQKIEGIPGYSEVYVTGPFWVNKCPVTGTLLKKPYATATIETYSG